MTITIKKTKKKLSANAGLLNVKKLLHRANLRLLTDEALPVNSVGKNTSFKKFTDLLLALIAGADCLDDLKKQSFDEGFLAICDEKVYSPKSYGDFLRSFTPLQITTLQNALCHLAFKMRKTIAPKTKQFFFDMDSTHNVQYGSKMEGVETNYKNQTCLDSLDVFDELGLQYHINVRPGNTSTATGAEIVIHNVMTTYRQHKQNFSHKTYVCWRFDRGYYSKGVVNACVAKDADVIIGVRQDSKHFPMILGQIHNWKSTDQDDPQRIKFYDGREVEIGSTRYRPKGYARRLRYVVMRAKKPADPLFPDFVVYDYYAFATTFDEDLYSDEGIIFKYRKRGQAENHIKENKNGLDMKHYPCLKLDANRVYALICAFAYNFMRLMSLVNDRKKPILAKNIRFRWIHLPCLVARTGRGVIFRFMEKHYQEMLRWMKLIHNLQFE